MRLPAAMFLTASILIAAGAVFVSVFTLGTTVTYDGNELGTVPTEAAAAPAISVVEDEPSDVLGDSFTWDMSRCPTPQASCPGARWWTRPPSKPPSMTSWT